METLKRTSNLIVLVIILVFSHNLHAGVFSDWNKKFRGKDHQKNEAIVNQRIQEVNKEIETNRNELINIKKEIENNEKKINAITKKINSTKDMIIASTNLQEEKISFITSSKIDEASGIEKINRLTSKNLFSIKKLPNYKNLYDLNNYSKTAFTSYFYFFEIVSNQEEDVLANWISRVITNNEYQDLLNANNEERYLNMFSLIEDFILLPVSNFQNILKHLDLNYSGKEYNHLNLKIKKVTTGMSFINENWNDFVKKDYVEILNKYKGIRRHVSNI